MKQYLAYLYILLSGSLWGIIGLFNRGLSANGFAPMELVTVRNLGAVLLMGLIFLMFDRSVFKVQRKHLKYFFGTGIVSVLLFTPCYFMCQQMCSLAVAAILLYTAPTFVVILSAILWKDKITKRKLAALIITFLGCTFASGIWTGSLTVTAMGLFLGVCSGFFYGMYSIFGRYALEHYQPFTVTFYTFVFAGAGAFLVVRPTDLFQRAAQPENIGLFLGLIVLCTVLPYLLYTKGLAEVDSGKAAILASIEPPVAALAGVVAFGEPMSLLVLLGLGCILLSVYILR